MYDPYNLLPLQTRKKRQNGATPPVGIFGIARGDLDRESSPPSLSYDLRALVPARTVDTRQRPAAPSQSDLAQWRADPRQCPLVVPALTPGTIAPTGADLRFSPRFASVFAGAADALSRKGIRLSVNNGFRTAADQWHMAHGASGRNPAATYSDHQLGNAVDINGTRTTKFPAIVQAFRQAGAAWGGDYRGKKDPPHFYIRPVRANPRNTAECERENPRPSVIRKIRR